MDFCVPCTLEFDLINLELEYVSIHHTAEKRTETLQVFLSQNKLL